MIIPDKNLIENIDVKLKSNLIFVHTVAAKSVGARDNTKGFDFKFISSFFIFLII